MMLLILCFVPRVLSEVSLQHHFYVSRKSRSNLEPFETKHVYNDISRGPETFSTFDTLLTNRHIDGESNSGPILEISRNKNKYVSPRALYNHPNDLSKHVIQTTSTINSFLPQRELDSIAKSESKYTPGFLPSKIKTDVMYKKLKSAMHYQPPVSEMMYGYENEYHIDDDDLRISSRGLHDSWPYYYHNPYDYEHMRIDTEKEKAKDKRYAVDSAKIIPIHEDLSDDIPNSREPLFTTDYYLTTTDNPMNGNEPFFSFMLNDYFNKNNDHQDELTFKELGWGKDFDHEMSEAADVDDYANRIRRLPISYNTPRNLNTASNSYQKQSKIGAVKSESATEKGHKFDKHEKGDVEKAEDKTRYQENGLQQTGFKDFVDTFVNNFGSKDQAKDSKYILKRNQNKGENKKGFRRVYHKDEYQEDNEFYDNNNSNAQSEDKGSSNAHIGGSEALLKSHASAKLGNQASAYDKFGNAENMKFENDHKGFDKSNTLNSEFHRYRDIAKNAAQINAADYSDH